MNCQHMNFDMYFCMYLYMMTCIPSYIHIYMYLYILHSMNLYMKPYMFHDIRYNPSQLSML